MPPLITQLFHSVFYVCRLGRATCLVHTLNVFSNTLPMFPIFSANFFVTPPPQCNCWTLEFDIALSKFPKMFDEDSISQIRASCYNCDVEGGGQKSRQKNQTDVFDFLEQFSSPIEGPAMIAMEVELCGWLGDKNRIPKKSNRRFGFLWRDLHHPLRVLQ